MRPAGRAEESPAARKEDGLWQTVRLKSRSLMRVMQRHWTHHDSRRASGGSEEAHPPKLGEFALMRVKHEVAGIAERRLEDRAFPLAQGDRVGMIRGRSTRACAIGIEEHSVQ